MVRVQPAEPTTSSSATTCREVDGGPGLWWIGASGCGVGATSYAGGLGGRTLCAGERETERPWPGQTASRRVSKSLAGAFGILVNCDRGVPGSTENTCPPSRRSVTLTISPSSITGGGPVSRGLRRGTSRQIRSSLAPAVQADFCSTSGACVVVTVAARAVGRGSAWRAAGNCCG